MFNANFLFASLFWGSIGVGYCVFGKRQRSWVSMTGGLVMLLVSYVVASAILMSLVCLGIIGLVYFLLKQGY